MELEELLNFRITGSLVHEYVVCPRAAWFSYRHIRMENELLMLGRILHEKSYKREIKNIFNEHISLDFVRTKHGEIWIYEVKKSSKMLEAARWQLLFYLYYLREKGIDAKGKLAVPLERYNEEITLTEENIEKLKRLLNSLIEVVTRDSPPRADRKRICEKCSYFELCWV